MRFAEASSSILLIPAQAVPDNAAVAITHPMGVAAVAIPNKPRIPLTIPPPEKKVVATSGELATAAPAPAAPRGPNSFRDRLYDRERPVGVLSDVQCLLEADRMRQRCIDAQFREPIMPVL